MKKHISKYIKTFFDKLGQSSSEQDAYSKDLVPFNKHDLFDRITNEIESKEDEAKAFALYKKNWLIAASFIGVLFICTYAYMHFSKRSTGDYPVWKIKTSAIDRIDSITLEDGTYVWLNVNSYIRYPEHFNGNSREVILIGEAYFDVKHNPKKPFIIHSSNINTTVLGTRLDVNAYQNNKIINVTVQTGKVQVFDSINRGMSYFIRPEQQISFHKKDKIFSLKKEVNLLNSIGWTKNKLIFEDKALEDIIPLLNRKFGVKIQIDSSAANCEITANFEDESLDNVLRVLSIITHRKVVKHTNEISLTK